MPRIVQDSDDESGLGTDLEGASPVKPKQPDEVLLRVDDDRTKADPLTGEPARSKSTGSSEKLQRDIQQAHRALVEPTPSGKRRALDDLDIPSSSPAQQPKAKRAKTTDVSSKSHGDLKKLSRTRADGGTKQRIQTVEWDVPSSQDDMGHDQEGENAGHADGTIEGNASSEGEITQEGLEGHDQEQETAGPVDDPRSNDTIMDTASSNRPATTVISEQTQMTLAFENHDPNELFPASTSLDTATNTPHDTQFDIQARNVFSGDEHMDNGVPANVHSTAHDDVDELQRSQESIAMSSRSRTRQRKPSKETGEQHADEQTPDTRRREPAKQLSSQLTPSDELVGLPKERYKPRPSRSRAAPSTQSNTSDSTATPAKANKTRPKRAKTTGFTFTSPKSQLLEMGFASSKADWALHETNNNPDDAAMLLTGDIPSRKMSPKKSKRKSILDAVVEEEEEEEEGKADEQSMTPSSRPSQKTPAPAKEAHIKGSANMKRKRIVIEDDEVESQNTSQGHADQIDESENAQLPTEAEPEDTVQGVDREPQDEQLGTGENAVFLEKHNDTPGVQQNTSADVDQPNKKAQRTRGRPKKSEVVVEEDPEEEEAQEEPPREPAEVEVSKTKKGRGRPKKAQQQPEEIVTVTETRAIEHAEADPETAPETRERETSVLRETIPNTSGQQTGKTTSSEDRSHTASEKRLSSKDPAVISSSPPKHSPIKKDRLSYKVGLSRRMRVEPLLRMIKK